MTERLDVLISREYEQNGEKKNAYTRVGVAFATRNGGWSVKLEAIPAPKDGVFEFVMFPPKAQDGQAQAPKQNYSNAQQGRGAPVAPNFGNQDDDIPFAQEMRG